MGLLSTSRHFHNNDNSISIRFPDTIKVEEHKAPTDESIRLMEEMHDKALKNIIAKVKVEDNVVNGECWYIEQPWNMNDIKLIFKFKINGQEFTVEKELSRGEIGWDNCNSIENISLQLGNYAKAVMLWYALKMFTGVAYEKITNTPFPKELLR
jgi:hypothetical protein